MNKNHLLYTNYEMFRPKYALSGIKKKLNATNPNVQLLTLQVFICERFKISLIYLILGS